MKRKGFTLLETIISLALLSILFLSIMGIFGSTAKNVSMNAQDINNANLAKSELNLAINDKDYKGKNQQMINTFMDVEVLGTQVPVRFVSAPVENGTNGTFFMYIVEGVPINVTPDPKPKPDNKYDVTDNSNIFIDFNGNYIFDKNTAEEYIDENCLDDFVYYGDGNVVINGYIDRGKNSIHMEMENDLIINPYCGIDSMEDMYFKAKDIILSSNSDVVSSSGNGNNITLICDNFYANDWSSVGIDSNNSNVIIDVTLDVVLLNGSKIVTKNGGDIDVDCRNLLLSDESNIHIRNGGSLYVNASNDIKLTSYSYFATNNGSILEVNCGNNLDIDNGYINVGSNTDITINVGNDITLLKGGYASTESGDIIVACNNFTSNSGKLVVNGNACKVDIDASGNVNLSNGSELYSQNGVVEVYCYNYVSENSKIDISKKIEIEATESINLLKNSVMKSSNDTTSLKSDEMFIVESIVSGNSGLSLVASQDISSMISLLTSGNNVVSLNGENIYFKESNILASGNIEINSHGKMHILNKSSLNTSNNEVKINATDFIIEESSITARNTIIKGNTAAISGTSTQNTVFNTQNGATTFDIAVNGIIFYGKIGQPSAYLNINGNNGYLINKNETRFENLVPEVKNNLFK